MCETSLANHFSMAGTHMCLYTYTCEESDKSLMFWNFSPYLSVQTFSQTYSSILSPHTGIYFFYFSLSMSILVDTCEYFSWLVITLLHIFFLTLSHLPINMYVSACLSHLSKTYAMHTVLFHLNIYMTLIKKKITFLRIPYGRFFSLLKVSKY